MLQAAWQITKKNSFHEFKNKSMKNELKKDQEFE